MGHQVARPVLATPTGCWSTRVRRRRRDQRSTRHAAWPSTTSPSTVAVGVGVEPAASRASRSSSGVGRWPPDAETPLTAPSQVVSKTSHRSPHGNSASWQRPALHDHVGDDRRRRQREAPADHRGEVREPRRHVALQLGQGLRGERGAVDDGHTIVYGTTSPLTTSQPPVAASVSRGASTAIAVEASRQRQRADDVADRCLPARRRLTPRAPATGAAGSPPSRRSP